MRPDRCGFGRDLSALHPGDRKAVEDFGRFLAGELALAADGITFVSADSSDAAYFAPPKGAAVTTMEIPAVIDSFRDRWAFLSNFHPAPLDWEGARYPTSEHAFNAGKTLDPAQRQWIASAPTPREAKRRGRSVRLRDDWDTRVRFEVMAAVLRAKFGCHPQRVAALLSTGDATLIEGNDWCHVTWGMCRCARHRGAGENYLGLALMLLRAELRGVAA
jgi:ribA/ribD-fused uncharacterized protein